MDWPDLTLKAGGLLGQLLLLGGAGQDNGVLTFSESERGLGERIFVTRKDWSTTSRLKKLRTVDRILTDLTEMMYQSCAHLQRK